MKSFSVREGHVLVDGVVYRSTPSDAQIKGKMGMIHSINIPGRGQFFPIDGVFNDGTIKTVDSTTEVLDEPIVKKKAKATKMVESNGEPLDEKGNLIGKKKKAKKK